MTSTTFTERFYAQCMLIRDGILLSSHKQGETFYGKGFKKELQLSIIYSLRSKRASVRASRHGRERVRYIYSDQYALAEKLEKQMYICLYESALYNERASEFFVARRVEADLRTIHEPLEQSAEWRRLQDNDLDLQLSNLLENLRSWLDTNGVNTSAIRNRIMHS